MRSAREFDTLLDHLDFVWEHVYNDVPDPLARAKIFEILRQIHGGVGERLQLFPDMVSSSVGVGRVEGSPGGEDPAGERDDGLPSVVAGPAPDGHDPHSDTRPLHDASEARSERGGES